MLLLREPFDAMIDAQLEQIKANLLLRKGWITCQWCGDVYSEKGQTECPTCGCIKRRPHADG